MASPLNLLQLNQGAKSFGAHRLFEGATFSVNEGEHIGVIGPNGAGKSTLFKIIVQEEDLDQGQLIKSQQLRIGYLSQHDQWEANQTGNEYLAKTTQIPIWELKSRGRELQVSEEKLDQPILSLSGGYRMRIKLMALLGQNPNLMLLDEPTNYLDLETTLLLERFLQNFDGAFLLISHDREFLRRTTDHILEVEAGDFTKYNGNIDDYFEQKELLKSQLQAQSHNQMQKRQVILDFVQRFGAKATKARQAQSRLKSLEKMETIEIKALPQTAVIKIPEPPHVGKSVLALREATFGYGAQVILPKVNIEVQRGDHLAVVGLNGVGKSTLLKGLAGTLLPQRGERQLGYQVEVAIFNQHVVEILNAEDSIYESLESGASPDVTPQEIRNLAGSLLFSSDQIEKKIKFLSGGEKSRVALGRILLMKAPCLLLDEPTNHLDFQTVEALTEALRLFSGTLIVVSHDRGFIRRIASKIIEIQRGDVHLYPGNYDDYVWNLQKRLAEGDVELNADIAVRPLVQKNESAKKSKDIIRELRQLEKQIISCEEKIDVFEKRILKLNDLIVQGGDELEKRIRELSESSIQLQSLEVEWLALIEKRDSLK